MLSTQLTLLSLALLSVTSARWLDPRLSGRHTSGRIRTVVTTDMEQDDLTSLIRYLLYTNDVDTQGIIYSASRYHWEGDYKGTTFYLPGREYTEPQTSWRWTGNTTIQDIVLPAYAQVYDNLKMHDPGYPTPDELQYITKIGNVDFEGEFDHDSEGSDLIKALILDDDPRELYLQAWGGTNTIARALKSIEEQHSRSHEWAQLKARTSRKVVIMASGFQDGTYDQYIAPAWPELQVRSSVVAWTVYDCNLNGTGSLRGLPDDHVYFTGAWIAKNIERGPYGEYYRSWLDGQHMPGDQLDVFGNTSAFPVSPSNWCQHLDEYDFLSEGDDGTYFPLLSSGMQDPTIPGLGGWGGRSIRNTSSRANLWASASSYNDASNTQGSDPETDRFISAMQNDFAARLQWGLKSKYSDGNHAPLVRIKNGNTLEVKAGSNATLFSDVSDPDGQTITTSWWQYVQEGTYNGTVSIASGQGQAVVQIPADAKQGQTVSIILQGTDEGQFPLTRYARMIITIC